MRKMRKSICGLLTLLLCLTASMVVAETTQYQIRDLSGVIGKYTNAKDINNNGVIVGDTSVGGTGHAFCWSESTGLVDLGNSLGAQRSMANAINVSGKVVGYGNVSAVVNGTEKIVSHAMLWDLNGNTTDLGVLPGAAYSMALDINDNGEILGLSTFEIPSPTGGVPSYIKHTVIWDQNGNIIQDLGALFTGSQWAAWEINNNGDIRGQNMGTNGKEYWLRHRDGSMTSLNEMGGEYISTDAINDYGLVAGSLHDADNLFLATVWNSDGSIRSRLNPLAGDEYTMAYDINNSGIVVGESSTYDNVHAVIWNADGTIVELSSLPGFETSRAYMINDKGWVVGEVGTSGDWRTVLWTPVPEPATLLTLVCGLGGMTLLRRKHHD